MVVQTNQRGIAPGEDEPLEAGGNKSHEDMVLETDFVIVPLDDNDSATTTEVKALKGQVNGMSMTTAGVSVAALRGKNLVRITTSKGAKAGDHEFDVSGSGGKKITMKLSIRKEIDEPGAPDLVLEKNLIELAVLDEEVDSIVKIQGKAAAAQTSVKGLSVDLKEPGQIRVRAARDVSPGEHAIDVRGSAGNVVKLRVKIKPADLVLENDLLELRLRAGGPVEGIVKVKGKVASAHPPLAGLSVDVQHEGEIRVAARRDTQPGDWVMDVRGMAGNTVKLKLKILRDTLVLEKDVVDLRVPWDGQAEQIVNVKTGQVVAAQPLVKGITVDIKDDKSIRVAAGKNSPTGDWAFDILGAAGDRAKLKVRIQRENALELDRESLELRLISDQQAEGTVKVKKGKAVAVSGYPNQAMSVDVVEEKLIRVIARNDDDAQPGEWALAVKEAGGQVVQLKVKILIPPPDPSADLKLSKSRLELQLLKDKPAQAIVKIKNGKMVAGEWSKAVKLSVKPSMPSASASSAGRRHSHRRLGHHPFGRKVRKGQTDRQRPRRQVRVQEKRSGRQGRPSPDRVDSQRRLRAGQQGVSLRLRFLQGQRLGPDNLRRCREPLRCPQVRRVFPGSHQRQGIDDGRQHQQQRRQEACVGADRGRSPRRGLHLQTEPGRLDGQGRRRDRHPHQRPIDRQGRSWRGRRLDDHPHSLELGHGHVGSDRHLQSEREQFRPRRHLPARPARPLTAGCCQATILFQHYSQNSSAFVERSACGSTPSTDAADSP